MTFIFLKILFYPVLLFVLDIKTYVQDKNVKKISLYKQSVFKFGTELLRIRFTSTPPKALSSGVLHAATQTNTHIF